MSNTATLTKKQSLIADLHAAGLGAKSTLARKKEADLQKMWDARVISEPKPAKPAPAKKAAPVTIEEDDVLEVRVARLWTRVFLNGRKIAKVSNTQPNRAPAAVRDQRLPKALADQITRALAEAVDAEDAA